jgi:phosphonate transport system substrate-binding protein
LACLSLSLTALCWLATGTQAESSPPFRIGFSAKNFTDVNENDAVAALRVWAQTFARDRGIPADPRAIIFRNVDEIAAALTNKTVDCISITTDEYIVLSGQLVADRIVIGVVSDSITVEYVLLVHRDSGIERLSDLRGLTLGQWESSYAALASTWLGTILVQEDLAPSAGFFAKITATPKITKAVLPVFFRQAHACLVTRNGFETMVDLNPQIGQQLKVLASSPPLIPVVFCFRSDYSSPLQQKIMNEITSWHLSPAGRQSLTIFHTDRLEEHPVDVLDGTLQLLATNQRLAAATAGPPRRK